jgi:hypothetical protein
LPEEMDQIEAARKLLFEGPERNIPNERHYDYMWFCIRQLYCLYLHNPDFDLPNECKFCCRKNDSDKRWGAYVYDETTDDTTWTCFLKLLKSYLREIHAYHVENELIVSCKSNCCVYKIT